ncbi:hypothetical protein [Eremococcus coleocola]|uniref:hypothetical protein n=1 Tax=Eremococcus coleocola TaxID=88132 RepID=UPI0003FD6E8A|nr:hypothetical protein [Eremococcus coleocola]
MAGNIKGITIEVDGKSTGLKNALKDVNDAARDTNKELRDVNKGLKFNPTNTELLAQKQELLSNQVQNTADKLKRLKDAQQQVEAQYANGDIGEEQYRAYQREIVETESKLEHYTQQLKEAEQAQGSFGAKMQETSGKFKEFGSKVGSMGKELTTKVTAPIAAAGTASFKMAADYQDALGATDQVFKNSAGTMKEWANSMPSYYGIAKGEALEYSNTMGAMLKNIGGLTEEQAAKQSQSLTQLAGDLSAMFGGSTESAVQALTGALKGNYSMLDNYGMAVNEATIKQKALELGLSDGTRELTLQEKQATALALITEQAADAQGQAAREANGASGSWKQLTTELKNLATDIGNILLPIITPMIRKVAEWVGAFKTLSPEMQKVIVTIGLIVAAIGPLLVTIGAISTAIGMILTPVGLVVAAVVAGVAAIIAVIMNWQSIVEWFSGIWNSFCSFIQQMISGLVAHIQASWTAVVSGVQSLVGTLMGAFSNFGSWVATIWTNIANGASQMKTDIGQHFQGVLNKARSVFQNVKNAISDKMKGAVNAVKNAVKKFKSIMDFKWSLPKLDLPRITVKGGFSLKPLRVPTFGIEWFAKGGIMTMPTIFGQNGGQLLGGGEAGPEAILPLNKKNLSVIGDRINAASSGNDEVVEWLATIAGLIRTLSDSEGSVNIDGQMVASVLLPHIKYLDDLSTNRNKRIRGGVV